MAVLVKYLNLSLFILILLSFNNHDAILKLVFQNFASFSIAHILSIEKENYCPDAYFLDNCTLNIHVNTMNEDIRNKVYKIFLTILIGLPMTIQLIKKYILAAEMVVGPQSKEQ